MQFYDAHNHLHDPRLGSESDSKALVEASKQAGVGAMVVNGSCEEDWPAVQKLAVDFPGFVLPSFGYHPWYVGERTQDWQEALGRFLDSSPSAVGEIGLDRWKPGLPYEGQEEVFLAQLEMAASRNLPVSIHCLQAWGRMHDLLRTSRRPDCGFLLHSYGGPEEMILPLTRLGAYFSFPGYFARQNKERQRATFRRVPSDRLLIETDAPDQSLPDELVRLHRIDPASGKSVNHPANLAAVAGFLSGWLGMALEELAVQLEKNFQALFGGIRRPEEPTRPKPSD